MADLPPLNEETCPPGTVLRPMTITYSEADVLRNIGNVHGDPALHREGDRLRVPHAMLLGPPIQLTHHSFHYETGMHIGSNAKFHDVAYAGEELTVSGVCQGFSERNRNKYYTTEVTIKGPDGRLIVEIEHVSLYSLGPRGDKATTR